MHALIALIVLMQGVTTATPDPAATPPTVQTTTAPDANANPAATETAAATPAPAEPEMVCRNERETGSYIQHRVCRPRQRVEENAERTGLQLRQMTPRVIPPELRPH